MVKKLKSETAILPVAAKLADNTALITESDSSGLQDLISHLAAQKFFVFDTETDGNHFMLAVMDGVGFYLPSINFGYYVNFYKCSEVWRNTVISMLRPIFEDDKVGKIGHNIIYDMHVLKNVGVDVKGPLLDTMVAAYIANPSGGPFGLKVLVPRLLHIEMRHYEDITRDNIVDMAVYCMEDARSTYFLYKDRKEALLNTGLWRHFNDIEMPFLRVLFSMERIGMKVDVKRLLRIKKVFERDLERYKGEFCQIMFGVFSDKVLIKVTRTVKGKRVREDVPFNIDSSDHLGELLYNVKKIKPSSFTKGGKDGTNKKPSTDKMALTKLASEGHHGLDALMRYRSMQKLLTSFVVPILEEHLISGRVHSSYLQHGTRTGRLSSSDPNFQNIPVKSKAGKALRRCFVADDGYLFIDADLSQIELRLMAHFSKDPNLVMAYKEGIDLHDLTGQLVLGLPAGATKLKENKAIRTLCKGLNFGLQYGAGPRKFAMVANLELPEGYKIDEAQAKEYITKYFRKYAGVKAFQLAYPGQVKRDGYAMTVLGRKRYLPDIAISRVTKEGWKKAAAAEREALSTLIQGTASDILKLAMITAHAKGLEILAQIHDQLLVRVRNSSVDVDARALKDCMENMEGHWGLRFGVPIIADVHIVKRWEGHNDDNFGAGFDSGVPE